MSDNNNSLSLDGAPVTVMTNRMLKALEQGEPKLALSYQPVTNFFEDDDFSCMDTDFYFRGGERPATPLLGEKIIEMEEADDNLFDEDNDNEDDGILRSDDTDFIPWSPKPTNIGRMIGVLFFALTSWLGFRLYKLPYASNKSAIWFQTNQTDYYYFPTKELPKPPVRFHVMPALNTVLYDSHDFPNGLAWNHTQSSQVPITPLPELASTGLSPMMTAFFDGSVDTDATSHFDWSVPMLTTPHSDGFLLPTCNDADATPHFDWSALSYYHDNETSPSDWSVLSTHNDTDETSPFDWSILPSFDDVTSPFDWSGLLIFRFDSSVLSFDKGTDATPPFKWSVLPTFPFNWSVLPSYNNTAEYTPIVPFARRKVLSSVSSLARWRRSASQRYYLSCLLIVWFLSMLLESKQTKENIPDETNRPLDRDPDLLLAARGLVDDDDDDDNNGYLPNDLDDDEDDVQRPPGLPPLLPEGTPGDDEDDVQQPPGLPPLLPEGTPGDDEDDVQQPPGLPPVDQEGAPSVVENDVQQPQGPSPVLPHGPPVDPEGAHGDDEDDVQQPRGPPPVLPHDDDNDYGHLPNGLEGEEDEPPQGLPPAIPHGPPVVPQDPDPQEAAPQDPDPVVLHAPPRRRRARAAAAPLSVVRRPVTRSISRRRSPRIAAMPRVSYVGMC